MTRRWLPIEEWPSIAPIFAEQGVSLPREGFARIRVAEEDGLIVAFLVEQWQPHAEPLWIHPDYRGKASWAALLADVEADVPGIYVFAPDEHIAAMAASQGLTRLPWAVYRREAVS